MNCFLSRGSGTNANEREDALWKWRGREEESERRRRAGWAGWAAGWVGVWLSNKDFRRTSWKHRLHRVINWSERSERPRAQMEGFKGNTKCCAEVKATSLAEEVQWQRQGLPSTVTLAGWLTLPSAVCGSTWLLAHFYTRSPTYLLPPTHCISYTHIDKGATQLMLMWPLGCTCTSCTLSGREQMDEWLEWVSHLQTQPPFAVFNILQGGTPVHIAHAYTVVQKPFFSKSQCLICTHTSFQRLLFSAVFFKPASYFSVSNSGIWK